MRWVLPDGSLPPIMINGYIYMGRGGIYGARLLASSFQYAGRENGR